VTVELLLGVGGTIAKALLAPPLLAQPPTAPAIASSMAATATRGTDRVPLRNKVAGVFLITPIDIVKIR